MDKINRYFLTFHIPSVTAGDTFLIPVPITGDIKNIRFSNEIAITAASCDIVLSSVTAAGVATAVVGGTMTVATAAALATQSLEIAKVPTTRVTAGGAIRGIMDSDATSAGPGSGIIEITI